jgi:transposase
MVYLVKKKIKNKIYLYLVESARINGKVKRIWQHYLGPEDSIKDAVNTFSKPPLDVTVTDFGLPVALMQIVKKLNLIEIIDKIVQKREQGISVGQYLVIAALNRCIKPVSKNKIAGWFNNTYLPHFFPKFETYLDSMAYTNHFSYLNPMNISKITEEINQVLQSKFHVDLEHLVYDTTNFYTYINPEDEDCLPQHGHSKENRQTLNLVGLSLLCTQDGTIPLLCDIYQGNVQDAQEFKWQISEIIERIQSLHKNPEDIILTFDKGNHSEEAFRQIDQANLCFIASIRPSTVKEYASLSSSEFQMIKLPNQKETGIYETSKLIYGKSRRLIVVYNPKQAHWNGENLRKKLNAEIEEITNFFQDRLNVKKWRNIELVRAKIESIISDKNHFQFIDYSLREESGQIYMDVKLNLEALEKYIDTLGKTYLITNHPTKDASELVWLFRQQVSVEKAFSYLKSPNLLYARPIFHNKDSSITGHLFSCVLGLLLITLLTREIRQTFPEMTMGSIFSELSSIELSEISYGGNSSKIRKLSHLSSDAEKLVDLLGFESLL